MQKKIVKVSLAVTALILIFSLNAPAQAPSSMVYQGRLADPDGNPISTETNVVFFIYEAAEAFDGEVPLWAEEMAITPDANGVFTVELGLLEPLDQGVFNGVVRYLGIKAGEDAEMTPRQVLSSAPYAINANVPAVLSGARYFEGGPVRFFGDMMTVYSNGIRIGDTQSPTSYDNLRIQRDYNTADYHYGIYSRLENESTGAMYGCIGYVVHDADVTGGGAYGLYGYAASDGSYRYGTYSSATSTTSGLSTGTSYGIRTSANYGATAYGIYASASGASTNYAGYFSGNVYVTGSVTKASGTFKIDHPLDPENKYLQHSFVESPDMMNIYNGNVKTDANGYAAVTLPDYFDALNKDFRYQLTVIGDFAQAIIAEEINENQFAIRTDKPNIKVSWQVTGIRKDAYAEANRIQVEVDKPVQEKGLYLHPEAFSLPPEMQIHYQQNLEAEQAAMAGSGN